MIIYLDPKTYQFLSTYAFKPRNIELELRFGSYKDGKFKPDIGQEKYTELDKYFRQNKQLINRVVTEQSISEIFSDGVRKINENGRVYYQRKNKLYTGDIEFKDFVLRLSESDEIKVSDHLDRPEDIVETRNRNRTLYYHVSGAFYYVLTQVTTTSQTLRYVTYELEVEYNLIPPIIPFLTRIVQDSINNILPVLVFDKNSYSYLPLSEESYVKDQYSNLYIREPKPVNLTRNITSDLQNMGYSLTNKLDGERFIVIFTRLGFYTFNNRKVEKYDTKNYVPPSDSNSFIFYALDTEFFEGRYYVFDCMIYNGNKIVEKSHQERLIAADGIIKRLGLLNDFLILKTFYRGDLKKHTQYLLSVLDKDKNDGLIYTSNGIYNSPIYKWKYPEKMSIDFSVYKVNPKKYDLYVKDNLEGFPINVPFHGNSEYELEEAFYETSENLNEGGIYEFGYDNTTSKFILFRGRPDKIDPNFITVAESVWTDIKNPYTSTELINFLSPKVLEQYRKYQNNLKRNLIDEYCSEKNVLDLGSGRGGDLGKYDSIGVNHLWCVEPNEKNYKELLRRLSERKTMKPKTTLITTVAQDTEKIVDSIRNTIVYDSPVIFSAKISLTGLLKENNPGVKTFTVNSFTSVDQLKNIIADVLSSEYKLDIDKSKFIVSNSDGDSSYMITDDYLYNSSRDLVLFVRNKNLLISEEQGIGKDFKDWFPDVIGIERDDLKITDEGMYSITKSIDSIAIIRAMKSVIGEENIGGLTIMDGTANVGGDTIRFAMNFNKVISVELDKENYDVLVNNVNVYRESKNSAYGFDNPDKIITINDDITKVYNDLQIFTDVLYLDPPWGGKGYKDFEEEEMVIFLSNLSLTRFIGNVLMSPSRPKYIFLKLPINYNIKSLKNMPYVFDMQVYTIRKFYLVCMTVDNKDNPLKKADVLTSFFSLSFFFFKDENGTYKDLDNLVDTIDRTIRDGGHFIGTTIDGEATKKLLDSSPKKQFDFEGGYIKFVENKYDDEPTVELLIKDTIVETQTESLVDFELLKKKLSERHISLEKSDIFLPSELLTEKENKLNSLYRYFVFKKDLNNKVLYDETMKDIKNKIVSYKDPLNSTQVMTSMSVINSDNCDKYLDALMEKKNNIGTNHLLYDFNYTIDWSRVISSYDTFMNIDKEYINSTKASSENINGVLVPSGLYKGNILFNIGDNKKYVGTIDKLFNYPIDVIMSCLYQLYSTASLLSYNKINLTNPLIFISKDNSIKSVVGEDFINIEVVDGLVVSILNYSYTSDISAKVHPFPFTKTNYQLIEILQYFPDSYKKSILYSDKQNEITEFTSFILNFIDIKKRYMDFFDHRILEVYDDKSIMEGYNGDNNIDNLSSIYLGNSFYSLEDYMYAMSDEDYDYFEKMSRILNKKSSKVSNKIYKWLEVLSVLSVLEEKKSDIKVFSNGYMPQMFLQAMRSYLDRDFQWHSNTNTGDELKCGNSLDIDTSDLSNIEYIENKMKRGIDIYASYTNKDSDNFKRFLGDILFGLVTLKNGGTMIFNMKSFFRPFECSVLGLLVDMFNGKIELLKPYSSKITESETYVICSEYQRDNSKISLLKSILMDKKNYYYTIPDSLNVKKYSLLLLACYTIYGRQDFFINKDIELYTRLKNLGIKQSELSLKNLKNSSDKFVSYYVKKRIDLIEKTKTIQEKFNVKVWNDYGCKKAKKKILNLR